MSATILAFPVHRVPYNVFELCPRTLALIEPGHAFQGVFHKFQRGRCELCGVAQRDKATVLPFLKERS